MNFGDLSRSFVLSLTLTAMVRPALGQQPDVELGIHHPLECMISSDLEATVYIYNRSDRKQFFLGDVAAEDGTLLLSGDWRLILEQVKNGEVVWSKRLEAKATGAAQRRTLAANSDRSWKARIPLHELVTHAGNYRFRVSHAAHTRTGRVFRVVLRRPGDGRSTFEAGRDV